MPKICIHCGIPKEEADFSYDRTKSNPERRNTSCKACQKIRQGPTLAKNKAVYYARALMKRQENRAKVQAQKRAYYVRHQDRLREEKKTKYLQNRIAILKKNSEWRTNNPERIQQSRRKNQSKNTAKNRIWFAAHPEKRRVYSRRYTVKNGNRIKALRRARHQALPALFTKEQEHFCRQYWNYACAYCGREEGFTFIIAMDHFIALSDPSSPGTVPWNMLPACHGEEGCNNMKHRTQPKIWLEQRYGPRKTKRLLQQIEAYFDVVRARQH